jgi:hypothetical protein
MGDEVDGRHFKAERGGSKASERSNEAILESGAVCWGAGTIAKVAFHGAEAAVVDMLACILVLWSIDGARRQGPLGAGAPGFGCGCGLRFNPRPTECGMHLAMNYGNAGAAVPEKQGKEKKGTK